MGTANLISPSNKSPNLGVVLGIRDKDSLIFKHQLSGLIY